MWWIDVGIVLQEESERLRLQAEKNEIRNVRRSFRSVISDNPEIIKIFPSGEADLIMRFP